MPSMSGWERSEACDWLGTDQSVLFRVLRPARSTAFGIRSLAALCMLRPIRNGPAALNVDDTPVDPAFDAVHVQGGGLGAGLVHADHSPSGLGKRLMRGSFCPTRNVCAGAALNASWQPPPRRRSAGPCAALRGPGSLFVSGRSGAAAARVPADAGRLVR